MSETTISKPAPMDGQQQTPGAILRGLREEQGLTLNNVSESLRLTIHYIKALENDDYGKLPGLTFVKGYLRSYSSLVKADIDAVMRSYDKHIASMVAEDNRTEEVQRSRRRHDQAMRWAVATTMVVVAGVAGGWWFLGQEQVQPPRYVTAPQTQQNAVSATAARTPPAAAAASAPATSSSAAQISGNAGAAAGNTVALPLAATAAQPGPVNAIPAPVGGTVPALVAGGLTASVSAQGATTTVLTPEIAVQNPAWVTVGPPAPAAQTAAELAATGGPTVATAALPATTIPAVGDSAAGQETVNTAATTAMVPMTAANPQTVTAIQVPATTASDTLTVTPVANGTRQVNLVSAGDDLLQLDFTGNSWVEIDDGKNVRLYNDMLRTGDVFTIRGTAPFHVLFGDGRNVRVTFNSAAVDIAADIRADSTARVTLPAATAAVAPTAAMPPPAGVTP